MKTIAIGAVTAGGKTTLVHALETVLPSSDYVLDGTKPPERLLNEAMQLILSC